MRGRISLSIGLMLLAGGVLLALESFPSGAATVEEDTSRARELFAANCAACHGPTGTGLIGPSLVDVGERLGREEVARVIAQGRVDQGMPAWGGVLSDDEITALIDLTETLPDGAVEAGDAPPAVVTGLDMPTSMSFAEDGGLYIGEKRGTIKYVAELGEPPILAADLHSRTYDYGELGLTGLVVHGDHLYVTLQTGMTVEECGPFEENYDSTCVSYGEVLRLSIRSDGALGAPESLRGGPDDPVFCAQFSAHGIAGLLSRDNGDLLVAAGDGAGFFDGDVGQHDGDPCGGDGAFRAQSPSGTQAAGTVAILGEDGSLTTFAKGLRNPFAMTELDGQLYVGNTGWKSFEEIDRVSEGHNSGWPCYEGFEPVTSYEPLGLCDGVRGVDPVFAYPNAEPAAAIASLAAYDGLLYFGDYVQQWVKTIDPELGPDQEPQLVARQLMPVALEVHDDMLYGLDFFAGLVVRLAGEPQLAEGSAATVEPTSTTGFLLPGRVVLLAGLAVALVLSIAVFARPRRAQTDDGVHDDTSTVTHPDGADQS